MTQRAPIADIRGKLHSPAVKQSNFEALMHEACAVWGFCGCIKNDKPLHVTDFIPSEGPVSADQFVEWLFLADDLNPNSAPAQWQHHREALRAAFITHMGAQTVDARLLWWGDVPQHGGRSDEKFRGALPDEP